MGDDDFKRNFMSKVRGDEQVLAGEVVPAVSVSKKSIDKRWFVIVGMGVLLIVVFVVLNVVIGKGGGNVRSVAIGSWGCDNDVEMRYKDDGTYSWTSSIEALIVESGTFTAKDASLTLTRTAMYIDDALEDSGVAEIGLEITMYSESSIVFVNNGSGENYTCMRVLDE